MCGLVGFVGGDWASGQGGAEALLRRMAGCIAHRGPDGTGTWADSDHRVGFGHNRLAILDLSPAGDQPMQSASGRYVIAYNGEVYNHEQLRHRLHEEGRSLNWRGHSDTETLLAGIEAWGIRATLERATGMFAFALWDRQLKQLTLARDRLGEKPLFYGWQGTGGKRAFLFGSELKAIAAHPAFQAEIDREALTLYMRHAYVPAPYSIYQGIRKLPAGALLTLGSAAQDPVIERYWSGAEVAKKGSLAPRLGGTQDYVNELDHLLSDAVRQQMISDVPLGAFLSGGVDSSTIVSLMQAQSSRPVRTFSIGFHEEAYNEAQHAKAVARHLGTDHTELYVTAHEAMSVVPQLPGVYDEPFADSSQIPTMLVSKLAREHVTVALSGDAGDELFAGYNRYKMTAAFWRKMSRIPRPLRSGLARGIGSLSPAAWDKIASVMDPALPDSLKMSVPGEKIIKVAGVLPSRSLDELYRTLVSTWQDPGALVVGGSEPAAASAGMSELTGLGDIERMMAADMLTYLPDDILVKVDRAAMSVSLETRVPFLDHRIVEFAWSMPMDLKLRDGQSKWALRQLLYRYVPKELIERPKMGFGVPIDSWLRGPLKDWAEDLLDEGRLRREGYFRPEPIRRSWAAHQSGRANLQHQLWAVLMFQSWLEEAPHQATTGTSAHSQYRSGETGEPRRRAAAI
jgi:asparagine synthase (glutamine-hydrolysing)